MNDAFIPSSPEALVPEQLKEHVYGHGIRCFTEGKGHKAPRAKSVFDLMVDSSAGFIPIWDRDTTLHWRFKPDTLSYFAQPDAAKAAIRKLFATALLEWGNAVPVKFKEDDDTWDFQFVVREGDACNASGCVLAQAFFPDAGRHDLLLYPRMFQEPEKEQVETLIHEFGHVFGLRHFFAQISEKSWPSEIFGEHAEFSIMNYGSASVLTDADRNDLARLYRAAWSGELTQINGTPIRLMRPRHLSGQPVNSVFQPAAIAHR